MQSASVDLKQTEFKNDEELKTYLGSFALKYAALSNEIELLIYDLDRQKRRAKLEGKEIEPKDLFAEYKSRYTPLFEEYFTDRKRTYGKCGSYGSVAAYDGIENSSERRVEFIGKNRAEAYLKAQNDTKTEYIFLFVRKNGVWRIDNVKKRICYDRLGDEAKWRQMIVNP